MGVSLKTSTKMLAFFSFFTLFLFLLFSQHGYAQLCNEDFSNPECPDSIREAAVDNDCVAGGGGGRQCRVSSGPLVDNGAEPGPCGGRALLGIIPPWHKYLQCEDGVPVINELNHTLGIGFAITEMLLRIIVIAAIVYFMIGSIKLMASSGAPDKIASAKTTLVNSIAGLIIGLSAGTITSYIAQRLNILSIRSDVGPSLISSLLRLLVQIAVGLAVLLILKAALGYVTSAGDSSKITSSKNTILYTVLGLLILTSGYVILSIAIGAL